MRQTVLSVRSRLVKGVALNRQVRQVRQEETAKSAKDAKKYDE